MYELVKTRTGWRVFWGPDPEADAAENDVDGMETAVAPVVLPFVQREEEPQDRPAA